MVTISSNEHADIIHTVHKLAALNESGAHPTEIVGFAESGDFFIAKQPLAFPFENFTHDLKNASEQVHAIYAARSTLSINNCAVFRALERCWFLADLHRGNIMRDRNGNPTIIDALIGSIPPGIFRHFPWLTEACHDALEYRKTGSKPFRDLFDGIDDQDL